MIAFFGPRLCTCLESSSLLQSNPWKAVEARLSSSAVSSRVLHAGFSDGFAVVAFFLGEVPVGSSPLGFFRGM